MEKPYRGLVYHRKTNVRTVKASPESEDAWEEPQDVQRTYPDGSIPAECWADKRAFAHWKRTVHAGQREKR